MEKSASVIEQLTAFPFYTAKLCSVGRPIKPPPAFIAKLPPSIGIIAPVIHDEASDANQSANPLMSSERPKRPRGMPCRNVSRSTGCRSIRASRPLFGLTTWAGKIALTRTPRPLHSVLSSLVM